LIGCLLSGLSTFASHIVAADLFYTWVSGDTYQVTVVLYGDCGDASAAALSLLPSGTPRICIYDGDNLDRSVRLDIVDTLAGVEITPLICPGSVTQCSDPASTIPGIKQFIYTGTVTLPRPSHVWRFVFTGYYYSGSAGRAAAITNIEDAGNSILQLVDTLDNTTYHNSSPVFTALPTPFFCQNSNSCYAPGAVDVYDSSASRPGGDSLVYALVPCLDGGLRDTSCAVGGPVAYIGDAWTYPSVQPVSGALPLVVDSAAQFSFDRQTGQICAFTRTLQRAAVAYNIREYRNGVFVGSCQREMTFGVQPCNVGRPTGNFTTSTKGSVTDTANFRICMGTGEYSLFINAYDPVDPTAHITITDSLLPPGAAFTTVNNGTNSPHSAFAWTTNGVAAGSYIFYVIFADDHCPYQGYQVKAFHLMVTDSLLLAPVVNNDTCAGSRGSVSLNMAGGTNPYRYQWQGASGDSIARHLLAGTYSVTVLDYYNCERDITFAVGSVIDTLVLTPHVINDICNGGFGSIEAVIAGGSEPYKYRWSNDSAGNRISGLLDGTYALRVTDLNNCSNTFSIDVAEDFCPPIIVHDVITPNGDGVNDLWVIEGIQNYPSNQVQLFDKWGDKVFEMHDYNNSWQGISNRGAALPDGTYFYIVRLNRANQNGSKDTWTGSLLIKR
jgi:gliding motility-associated-like protein